MGKTMLRPEFPYRSFHETDPLRLYIEIEICNQQSWDLWSTNWVTNLISSLNPSTRTIVIGSDPQTIEDRDRIRNNIVRSKSYSNTPWNWMQPTLDWRDNLRIYGTILYLMVKTPCILQIFSTNDIVLICDSIFSQLYPLWIPLDPHEIPEETPFLST
jgi:hypothetical protein